MIHSGGSPPPEDFVPLRHQASVSYWAPYQPKSSGALGEKSGSMILPERTAENLLFQSHILISRLNSVIYPAIAAPTSSRWSDSGRCLYAVTLLI